ncbi:MAG TPA: hypothetical protein VFW16_12075 [Streptosporangiaceae bacterium]|nr:hypothetical protein [Streptosporangiaceae bacterium]
MAAEFRPAVDLAASYYREMVGPRLTQHAPCLRHSAALIGPGSEVLGFDSPRSTDHNWGPRCQVFLSAQDADLAGQITAMLADRLPATFAGWPTRFADVTAADPAPRHWVEVAGLGAWLSGRLGFDPRAGVGLDDWLATPTQVLAEMTGGAVFSDGLDGGPEGGPEAARMAVWAAGWAAGSRRRGRRCAGIPMTYGGTCSPASGPGSARRRRFPAVAPRRVMNSVRRSSPRG